eukprot:Hpha_TRINITY_DN9915_c1_g1::TRINITY_DN9915_c1_g1_i1::g.140374::m.140374
MVFGGRGWLPTLLGVLLGGVGVVAPSVTRQLNAGQTLQENEWIESTDRWYRLVLLSDGNLCAYNAPYLPYLPANKFWETNTAGMGTGPYTLTLEVSGDFVLRGNGVAIWTAPGTAGSGAVYV